VSEFRHLKVCMEDIEALEKAGEELMRSFKTSEGLNVLTIALRLREAWRLFDPVFACDVDESAGMAEVVELREYGKKVGA